MNIKEAIDLYKCASTEELSKIANDIVKKNYSDDVFIRGLIEFSNYCDMDCLYCGIRKSNGKAVRYRLTDEEIIDAVKFGLDANIKTFVLQSGEDYKYNVKKLSKLVYKIKKITGAETAITLSCGLMNRDDYKELKDSGCDRYLMRFETSDENLYSYLKKGQPLKTRLKGLENLKNLGFEVGSGFMVGLPGETIETGINNALLCKELELDMIGIGPFIPHNETPLKKEAPGSLDTILRTTALLRILLPYSNIPATTATGSIDALGREKALSCGANVLMPNITPAKYKKNYLIYPGKICLDESGSECISRLSERVVSVGKKISYERGDSISYTIMKRGKST
ncbi:MAG TPA: [FeFe] hydrogenase H-cluster radical SAM maturase HydE, partial [Spirochaetota bacterium]|nr:[FeFe] hydrogenase H-cluster radical SAM maturase HydE [Spirochaetota bacterium]